MDQKKWGVHASHCCELHGCKYGNEECPITKGLTKQEYICEQCNHQGFKNVNQIEEYKEVQENLKKAKENGTKEITVNVDFLDRMLNHEPDWY